MSSNGTGSNGVGSQGTNSDGGTLPFTGGDVAGLAIIGLGAIAGGTALAKSGRRRAEV